MTECLIICKRIKIAKYSNIWNMKVECDTIQVIEPSMEKHDALIWL